MYFPEPDEIAEILQSVSAQKQISAGGAFVDKHRKAGLTLSLGLQLLPAQIGEYQDFQLFVAETDLDLTAMLLEDQLTRRSKHGTY